MRVRTQILFVTIAFIVIMVIGSITQTSIVSTDEPQSMIVDSELFEVPNYIAGTPHAPIFIDGDANFSDTATAEGWSGNGSEVDPYIIDGLDIDRGGAAGDCISISNTRVNFTIINCNLTGASEYVSDGTGIRLKNVTYCEIAGNLIYNNENGIKLETSDSNNLSDNIFHDNGFRGIYLLNSDSNNLSSNTLYDEEEAIFCQSSHSNTLVNNTFTNNRYAFYLMTSDFNTLKDNTCNASTNIGVYLDLADSNTLIGNTICDNDLGGIYIYQSESNNITKNICDGNGGWDLYSDNSISNNILRNAFLDSSHSVKDSPSDYIDYNYWLEYAGVDDNGDGIGDTPHFLGSNWDSHPLMFMPYPPTWNETPVNITVEFSHSLFYMKLNVTCLYPMTWSVNNTLFHVDNQGEITSAILPIGRYNLKVHLGNVWYDTELSASFSITLIDNTSPVWLISPANHTLEYGEEFEYQLAATDMFGIESWQVNDTTNFAIDEYGVITNATILDSGVYIIEVQAFDPYDNYCSATINITVLEADEPPTTSTTTTSTTTTTSVTTSTTTNQTVGSTDPTLIFVAGAGIGGGASLIIIMIILRRKT